MEIDYEAAEQPTLSPALLVKIADTFTRKLGELHTPEDALAWWDWVWPEFENYWRVKKYRSVSRAILGWAIRVRPSDLQAAMNVAAIQEDILLAQTQEELNESGEGPDENIDYFKQAFGGKK